MKNSQNIFKIISTTKEPTLPHLGIHYLSIPAILAVYPDADFPGENYAERIVHGHESKLQKAAKESGRTAMAYTFLPNTPLGENTAKKYGMEIQIVKGVLPVKSHSMREGLSGFVTEDDAVERASLEYIIFVSILRSEKPEAPHFLALSQSNAWRMVTQFSSYNFSRRIVQLTLNPDTLKGEHKSYLTGEESASVHFYNQGHQHTASDLTAISTMLTADFRNTPLLASLPFLTTEDSVHRPALSMSSRQVKLHKALSLEKMLRLSLAFANAYTKEGPFSGETLVAEPSFDYLDYIHPVSMYTRAALDRAVIRKIYDATHGKKALPHFEIHGRESSDYSTASKVKLSMKGESMTLEIDRSQDSVSLDTCMALIQTWPSFQNCDRDTFSQRLKDVTFKYGSKGKKYKDEPFMSVLNGEVVLKDIVYFHVDGSWYQVHADYLKLVDADFRRILRQSLIPKKDKTLALPYEWTPVKLLRAEKAASTVSDDTESVISDVSSVTSASTQKVKNAFKIKDLAAGLGIVGKGSQSTPKAIIAQLINDGFIEVRSQSAKIYKVLEKGAKKYAIPDKSKKGPDPYKLQRQYQTQLTAFLKRFYTYEGKEKKRDNDEEEYNKRYENKVGYVVGDKRLPKGLELFDVLKITKDSDTDEPLFIFYHNKLKFSQHVRDVASQICNAAQVIVANRMSESADNILGLLYDSVIDAVGAKETFRANGIKDRKTFIAAIRKTPEENLVFVFGFMNDYAKPAVLETERDRKDGEKPYLDSNIARLEILRTQRRLSKLNVTFKIATVERNKKATYYESLPVPKIPTLNPSDFDYTRSTDAIKKVTVIGRAGENDCWLTPFVWGIVESHHNAALAGLNVADFVSSAHWAAQKADCAHYTDADITGVITLLKGAAVDAPLSSENTLKLRQHLVNLKWVESMTCMIDPAEICQKLWGTLLPSYDQTFSMTQEDTCDFENPLTDIEETELDEDEAVASQQIEQATQDNSGVHTQHLFFEGRFEGDSDIIAEKTEGAPPILKVFGNQAADESFADWINCTSDKQKIEEDAKRDLYIEDGGILYTGTFRVTARRDIVSSENCPEMWVDARDYKFKLAPEDVAIPIGPSDEETTYTVKLIVEHYGAHYECYKREGDNWHRYEYGIKHESYDTAGLNARLKEGRKTRQARYKLLLKKVSTPQAEKVPIV